MTDILGLSSRAALETPHLPPQVHGVRHCAAARPAHTALWESADRTQPVVCAVDACMCAAQQVHALQLDGSPRYSHANLRGNSSHYGLLSPGFADFV